MILIKSNVRRANWWFGVRNYVVQAKLKSGDKLVFQALNQLQEIIPQKFPLKDPHRVIDICKIFKTVALKLKEICDILRSH